MTQHEPLPVPETNTDERSHLTTTFHHQLIEKMALGVVFQDEHGSIVTANPAAEDILGMTFDQMQGRTSLDPHWRAVHEDGADFPGNEHPAAVALRTGQPVTGVIMGVFHPRDNDYRWLSVNATPIFTTGEQDIQGVFVTFEDVTTRKLDAERLQESERRFRAMFEHAGIGMLQTLPDGRFIQVNQKLCAILGYSRDELLTMSYQDITVSQNLDQSVRLVRRALAGEFDNFCFEKQYRCKDGSMLWAQVTATLVHAADETPLYFLTLVEDISQRKQWQDEREQHLAREQELRASAAAQAAELEAIFEAIADGICVYDRAGAITRTNRAAHSMLGLPPEQAYPWVTAEDRSHQLNLRDEYGRALTYSQSPLLRILRGEVLSGDTATDLIITTPQGQTLQLAISGAPLLDDGEHVIGAVTIWRDVTERRRLESERMDLLERERVARQQAEAMSRQLQTVLDVLPVGVMLTDAHGHVLQLNATIKQIWEITALASLDGDVGYITSPEGHAIFYDEHLLARVLDDDISIIGKEMAIQTVTGARKAILTSATPIHDESGAIVGGVAAIIDITERRALEQRTHVALDALLTMAKSLVHTENMPPLSPAQQRNPLVHQIALLTRDILGCERVAFRLLAGETDFLIPLAVVGFTPEEEAHWYTSPPWVISQGWLDAPTMTQLNNGDVVLADLRQPPYDQLPNSYQSSVRVIAPLLVERHLIGVLTLDYGPLVHDFQRDELALIQGVARLATFVLERERLQRDREHALLALQLANQELATQNQRVERANRLKSEFLANMSHELRTPLNGIIGFADVLIDEDAGPINATQREFLNDVLVSSRHLLHLINDILDISKIEADKMEFYPEVLALGALVQEACVSLNPLIDQKRQHLTIAIDPALDTITADAAKLKQVLFNYLANAQKFTPEEGSITVRIFPSERDTFTIAVSDTGIGIAPADIARLFVVFQQLDSSASKRFQGTGLGLALTKRIVEAQGGQVGVESTVQQGSTFWARLPRSLTDVSRPTLASKEVSA